MSEKILNFEKVEGETGKRVNPRTPKPLPKTPSMPSDPMKLREMSENDLNVLRFAVEYPELERSAAGMSGYDREIHRSVHQRTDKDLTTVQRKNLLAIDEALAFKRMVSRETNIEDNRKRMELERQARKDWCETGDAVERFVKFYSEVAKWNWSHADQGDLTKIAIPKMKALIKEYKLEKIFK